MCFSVSHAWDLKNTVLLQPTMQTKKIVFLVLALFGLSLLGTFSARAEEPGSPTSLNGYIQVTDGCLISLSGPCLNVRSGPGTEFRSVLRPRIGVMMSVDSKVEKDGTVWYHLKPGTDLGAGKSWYVDLRYVRLVDNITELESNPEKHIVVDLSEQKLYAYEGDNLVFESLVSTGLRNSTPPGTFRVFRKIPYRHMQGADYNLPGVPWTMYFTGRGAAIHGTYWHNDFGHKHSHGCVNLPLDESEWMYRWTPMGTKVVVQK